tara:strand:- start:1050 stop:1331 length:282 start_codon:yes stop_codon:yes gene_type:complete
MLTEDTEITLSIREIVTIIVAIVSMTSIVVRYESKIDGLEEGINKLQTHIKSSAVVLKENTEYVRTLQIEQIKQLKDIEYIRNYIGDEQCQIK